MTGTLRQRSVDYGALAALCLLLATAVTMRVSAHGTRTNGAETRDRAGVAASGEDLVLSGGALGQRGALVGACRAPIPFDLVEPTPHGNDAALARPQNPDERVLYAYRGRMLGGRFAVTELAILHLLWRAGGVLRLDGSGGRDALAVKLTVPAGCEAGPEELLTALRRDLRAGG